MNFIDYYWFNKFCLIKGGHKNIPNCRVCFYCVPYCYKNCKFKPMPNYLINISIFFDYFKLFLLLFLFPYYLIKDIIWYYKKC